MTEAEFNKAVDTAGDSADDRPLLDVRGLTVSFTDAQGRSAPAVRDVELSVKPGEIVAVVGESGSGKSATALSVIGLLPKRNARVRAARIDWLGESLLKADERRLRVVRGAEIAMIFQEPVGSLNPVRTVGEQVAEAIRLHRPEVRRSAMRGEVETALLAVGIPDPPRVRRAYPHELSGGMCQRVMIAAALACEPKLLLADEPTTALDVTIQAQVLDLLQTLRRERGMSVLLISHDLGVVARHADLVNVMYAGRIVESAPTAELFARPTHPYTRALLASIPRLRERRDRLGTVSETLGAEQDRTVMLVGWINGAGVVAGRMNPVE
jgi:ABC-type dipeptide/oligopeptide/nickel transport system ATPase component